ncbi:acylneuraminate cytidylyltransferase family protein [endosymbiont of Ridgeia piscesae]|uniref:CMP-N-acetylneuraminic acid synthetase n=1 Tax=endosymbiont of Ridgeia piscesae TaxID=54398 RepID=A0A0T5Z956_9GAMM|nr:acylneuraminate cytidylyltransferase family protein [endosymbiont of Ridgeia piscesae]KRT56383.1 CMP-N-acetylneuraminic acid synthetase [endosymbiont of Ridgeia piscesae]KRT59399.1 N-acylneuraminate cytidylyltransferase [endosymbiont of Ridgeia piscesae]
MIDAVAIIPARGNSKRLPRKNILEFRGKPIIAYTIEAALQSGIFERVVVSTEDAEIAGIAAHHGAEVAQRSAELSHDSATVVDVCCDWLSREQQTGHHYQIICCLYATAPLRNATDVAATCGLLERGRCHYALAAVHYSHYPYQALRLERDGTVAPQWPELCDMRADQVGKLIAGNGSTYATFSDELLRSRNFYGPGMRAHIMPFRRSVDIDTADDLELALCLAELEARHSADRDPR